MNELLRGTDFVDFVYVARDEEQLRFVCTIPVVLGLPLPHGVSGSAQSRSSLDMTGEVGKERVTGQYSWFRECRDLVEKLETQIVIRFLGGIPGALQA